MCCTSSSGYFPLFLMYSKKPKANYYVYYSITLLEGEQLVSKKGERLVGGRGERWLEGGGKGWLVGGERGG